MLQEILLGGFGFHVFEFIYCLECVATDGCFIALKQVKTLYIYAAVAEYIVDFWDTLPQADTYRLEQYEISTHLPVVINSKK